MAEDRETQIRARAHELWQQAGRPEGKAVEFWLEAERELFGEDKHPPEASGTDADAPPPRRAGSSR